MKSNKLDTIAHAHPKWPIMRDACCPHTAALCLFLKIGPAHIFMPAKIRPIHSGVEKNFMHLWWLHLAQSLKINSLWENNSSLSTENLSMPLAHSSEIRGLYSTKCSSETLQNLLYFMYKKTHVVFFVFHFVQLYIFT